MSNTTAVSKQARKLETLDEKLMQTAASFMIKVSMAAESVIDPETKH